jgi:MTH538 TIR-like domain (DUF1863)
METPAQQTPGIQYAAFLSYSHADNADALKLHRWLERYVVPRALRTRNFGRRKLLPVFRDQEEFSASLDLGEMIRQALSKSSAMVVLCSENSASSRWVNEEVKTFLLDPRDPPIICVAIGPRSSNHPIQLPHCLRPMTSSDREPLIIDMRGERFGNQSERLRIIAALIGVGLDELIRRDRRHRVITAMYSILALIPGSALVGLIGTAFVVSAFLLFQSIESKVKTEETEIARLACDEALIVGALAGELSTSAPPEYASKAIKIQRSASHLHSRCQSRNLYLPGEDGYYTQTWSIP